MRHGGRKEPDNLGRHKLQRSPAGRCESRLATCEKRHKVTGANSEHRGTNGANAAFSCHGLIQAQCLTQATR